MLRQQGKSLWNVLLGSLCFNAWKCDPADVSSGERRCVYKELFQASGPLETSVGHETECTMKVNVKFASTF